MDRNGLLAPQTTPIDTHTPRPDRIGVFPSMACITSKIDVSTEPTRSAIISFLTTRYDRTALQDSTCVEMCSFGRQSRSDTPFPQGLEPFRASYVILPPPFTRHVDRRLGALFSTKPTSLAQALNHYPIDIISQQPEISALPQF